MVELAAHYLYFESLTYQPRLIEKCDNSATCHWSVIVCYGLRFYVHYLVRYGIALTVTRFDLLIPPKEPRCIARMGSFNEIRR